MLKGLARHGVKATVADIDGSIGADLSIMWGIKWPTVLAACHEERKPYLVMEKGSLGDQEEEVTLGYNGFKQRGDFCNDTVSDDRWRARFSNLLRTWREPNSGPIIVASQVETDSSVMGIHMGSWAQGVVAKVRSVLNEQQIVFRPHPLSASDRCPERATVSTLSLAHDLARASVVVTFNSTVGVDAILAGVPTIALDEGSMAWPVAAHELTESTLLDGHEPNRQRWAERLAYTQWNHAEIEAGEAWAHLQGGPGRVWN